MEKQDSTLVELKAAAYDRMVIMENAKAELAQINQMIEQYLVELEKQKQVSAEAIEEKKKSLIEEIEKETHNSKKKNK